MFKDLQFTLFFVRDFLGQNNLLDTYQQLITSYQQLQSSPSDEITQSIDSTKKSISEIHSRVNYLTWSAPKISILKRIGALELMGGIVTRRINNIVIKNGGNSTAIINGITKLKDETATLQSDVETLIRIFKLQEQIEKTEENRKIVDVSFEKNAILKNFWEMEDRGKEWTYIIRTFTRLTGEDFETVNIASMNSASPEVGVMLDMVIKSAEALIAGAKAAAELKKIKDVFLSKKKGVESLGIKEKSTFDLVMKDIEVQYEDDKKTKIGEMSVSITKEHAVKKPGSNDEHEIENMVGIALEKLSNLLGDGAKVIDPSENIPTGETPTDGTLGKIYSEIKRIETDEEITPLLEAESEERRKEREIKMKEELGINNEEDISETAPKRGRPKKEAVIPEEKPPDPNK